MSRIAAIAAVLAAPAAAEAGLLSVPDAYTPEKSWPVVISYQDNPSPELMKKTRYFLVHAGGRGTESRRKTIDYLKNLAKRYNIDPLRIYGTGFSRGGHEVLTLAWQHPHWYAAIAPVCNDLRREPKVLNVKYLTATPTLLLSKLQPLTTTQAGPLTFSLAVSGQSGPFFLSRQPLTVSVPVAVSRTSTQWAPLARRSLPLTMISPGPLQTTA